jgi:hypothetical protein
VSRGPGSSGVEAWIADRLNIAVAGQGRSGVGGQGSRASTPSSRFDHGAPRRTEGFLAFRSVRVVVGGRSNFEPCYRGVVAAHAIRSLRMAWPKS